MTTARGYQVGVDWSRQGLYTGVLEDVSSYVEPTPDVEASWGRSEPRATEDAKPGSMSYALRNNGREFSPENQSSPIAGKILPGTPNRLQVTDPSTAGITTLFLGPMDVPDVDPNAAGRDVSVSCSDGWGRQGRLKVSTPVYQGLRTGDLINVVLDAAGWPADRRSIDPGATVVPYWWVEGQEAANAVDDLVHSEGVPAVAYVAAGVFVFRDRHHRLLDPPSLYSQGTYTHLQSPGIWASASDSFSRSVSSGWGTADTGQAWTTSGGVVSDFNVGSGVGTQSHSAVNVSRRAWLASVTSEQIQATVSVPVVATGAALNAAVTLRNLDPVNDHYRAQLGFGLAGAMTLSLVERTGGADSTLATVALADTYAAGTRVTVRFRADGKTLRAKAWLTGAAEPGWQVSATDPTIGSGYPPGVRTLVATGNTNTLPVVFSVDDVVVSPTDDKILKGSFRYNHGLANVVNSASLEVTPRIPADRQVVWSTDNPVTLGASESQTLVIRTDDPVVDLQLPSALIAYLEDGTTTFDYHLASGAVSFALSRTSGQSALLTLTAGAAGAVLDTGLRLRGTPLRAGAARIFSAADVSSANSYGDSDWGGSAPWAHFYDADVLVRSVVSQFAQPRPTVQFEVDGVVSPATLTRILGTALSDRVTVRNDEMGLNADFMVEQLGHTIRRMGQRHILTVGAQLAEPAQALNPFTFDTAGQGFDQGQFALDAGTNPATMFVFDTAGHGFNDGRFAA